MSNHLDPLLNNDLSIAKELSQPQSEAFVDLLHFCTYADQELKPSEISVIAEAVKMLHWHSATSLNDFLVDSGTRAQAALANPASRSKFLAQVANQLGTTEVKTFAVTLCPKLFAADGEYLVTERAVFAEIRKALGWPT